MQERIDRVVGPASLGCAAVIGRRWPVALERPPCLELPRLGAGGQRKARDEAGLLALGVEERPEVVRLADQHPTSVRTREQQAVAPTDQRAVETVTWQHNRREVVVELRLDALPGMVAVSGPLEQQSLVADGEAATRPVDSDVTQPELRADPLRGQQVSVRIDVLE